LFYKTFPGGQILKIAITADNHLTTQSRNPERFQSLANILKQCGETQVQLLIIAGDLFDQSMPNYAEFEALYKKYRPPGLTTAIIPGNHDEDLNQNNITADGLIVHNEPQLLPLNNTWNILFVPYQKGQTMGSVIAPFLAELTGQRWILIGHGDWSPGIRTPDTYEPGVYMPLTRPDLALYKPGLVFLGHIHLPFDGEKVHYPGSPCPLNVSETGLRRFLLLDLDQGKITPKLVDSSLLFFNERFIMLSRENELKLLKKQMKDRIKSWELPAGWEKRVQVQVEIAGFAAGRDSVKKLVKEIFSPFSFTDNGEPDLKNLYHKPDPDREQIALEIQDWIKELEWTESSSAPSKTEILEEALKVIYGVE
jgi:DNA repair exonuclease SbcCD nuclease subunit